MNKEGNIIVIEDGQDDQDMFNQVFAQLNYPNKIVFFNNGESS